MKTKFLWRHLTLIAVFAVCFSFMNIVVASDEIQTVEADGYYLIGDGPDENHSVAKERARMDAKRMAAEKAGVLVESLSITKNYVLTADEVNTISSQVLRIQNEKIIPEVQGETIRYRCHIVAIVSTKDVMMGLSQDKEELYKAVQKNKQQEKELVAVKTELAALKKKYQMSSAAARQEINRQVKMNEIRFTAAKWIEKATEYSSSGDEKQAMECYNKAIELDAHYAPAWYNLGLFYTSLGYSGKHDALETDKKALKCYRKAVEIDAEYGPAWLELGSSYNSLGDTKKAVYAYRKATEVEPQNGNNWYALGGIYHYDLGDFKNAAASYRKAAEAYGKAPEKTIREAESWDFLGWAYYEMGDYKNAIDAFSKAKELAPIYERDYQNALKALG